MNPDRARLDCSSCSVPSVCCCCPELDLANGSFGSGTDQVKFGSVNLGLSLSGSGKVSVRVKFGFGSSSGQSLVGQVWIRFG